MKNNKGFTLAEVLITLVIIGIIAAMTIPNLIQNSQDSELASQYLKALSTISQGIARYKTDRQCYISLYGCLKTENLVDNDCTSFTDTIGANMKIEKTAPYRFVVADYDWIPKNITNVTGEKATVGIMVTQTSSCAYLLSDGTVLASDNDPDGFNITMDVNGPKGPNKVGRDIFPLTLGKYTTRDINYVPYNIAFNTAGHILKRLCVGSCDPNNLDPNAGNGVAPSQYVVLNKKIPKYSY